MASERYSAGILQRWQDARHQFDDSLRHLLKSAQDLSEVLSGPALNPTLLEKATVEADQYTDDIATRIEDLAQTQAILKTIRNRSTSLIPLNRLPLEILLPILRAIVFDPEPYDPLFPAGNSARISSKLLTITHVCTLWRSLVIQTPSFWSTVHVRYGSASRMDMTWSQTRAYLERAEGRPLTVSFRGSETAFNLSMTEVSLSLGQHFKNVRDLRLIFWSLRAIRSHLELWFANGQPGTVQNLTLYSGHGYASRLRLPEIPLPKQQVDSFLAPIRRLSLGFVRFEWVSPVYHNLVFLEVCGLDREKSPRLFQLLAILVASPKLRHLQLQKIHILPDTGRPTQPVLLAELNYLDLRGVNPDGLSLLLPNILAPSPDLSFKVGIHPNVSRVGSATRSFMSRTSISELFITMSTSKGRIGQYLSAVPDLTHLILDLNLARGADTLLEIIRHNHADSISECTPGLIPKLSRLTVTRGPLQNDVIQQVVFAYPRIQVLSFFGCFLEPSEEEVMSSLVPIVPQVIYDRNIPLWCQPVT